jgi:hypothetical protein
MAQAPARPATTRATSIDSPWIAHGPGWAGYVAKGTRYRYVQAQFRVTKLDCHKTPGTQEDQAQMADWVGLDGWTDKTVEQDGIGGFCTDGVPSYSAWWETYPQPPHYIFNMHAGDDIMAVVFYSKGKYKLELEDYTSGQGFSLVERCGEHKCANSTAEVITEDPGKADSKTNADFPLADCGTTEFWNIKVTSQSGLKGNFDTNPWEDTQVTMTDKHNTTMIWVGFRGAARIPDPGRPAAVGYLPHAGRCLHPAVASIPRTSPTTQAPVTPPALPSAPVNAEGYQPHPPHPPQPGRTRHTSSRTRPLSPHMPGRPTRHHRRKALHPRGDIPRRPRLRPRPTSSRNQST